MALNVTHNDGALSSPLNWSANTQGTQIEIMTMTFVSKLLLVPLFFSLYPKSYMQEVMEDSSPSISSTFSVMLRICYISSKAQLI